MGGGRATSSFSSSVTLSFLRLPCKAEKERKGPPEALASAGSNLWLPADGSKSAESE